MKKFMLFAISIALLSAGCSKVTLPNDPSNPMERMRYNQELTDARPEWTQQGMWEEGDFIYQVGQSMVFDTEREAKKHAYRDASFRLSEYITQSIDMDYSEMNVDQAASTNVINQSYATKEKNRTSSRSVISKISAWRTWVEPVFDQNEQLGYSAFAMVRIPIKSVKSATQKLKTAAIPEGPVANLDNL